MSVTQEINNGITETDLTAQEQLVAAATARSFELDPDRADRLAEQARLAASRGNTTRHVFVQDGLIIGRPDMLDDVDRVPHALTSRLDFVPKVNKDDDVIAYSEPHRGKTTEFTLAGIGAFQDFVLLADAGLLPKPERFSDLTNPTMAKFAQRLGFVKIPHTGWVTATYEDVASRVFSPEILEVQQRLQQRQAATAATAGSLALAG